MEEMSCILFHLLDNIGYNQEIIKIRRNVWQQNAREWNTEHNELSLINAGSKGEGITSVFESDIDYMCLFKDAIATDDIAHVAGFQDMTVLYTDTSEAPPGYTRLKLISNNCAHFRLLVLECIFESKSEGLYLSSPLFTSGVRKLLGQGKNEDRYCDISGPAVQDSSAEFLLSDTVFAFQCYYPAILQSWKSRPRHHEWPYVDVREDAASMLAQVVPVGSKGSCDQWREWRFCFIQSELKLTCSLNETQLKLYILLKIIAKQILCHVSKEISSYIMKNITYWLSELLPGRVFRRENLFTLLFLSMRFLKSSISQWNCLPYYMIPGRNLLAERLTHVNRRQLSELIETLIEEGPQFILRCTKLKTWFIVGLAFPALLLKYSEAKDRLEILMYCHRLLREQNADRSTCIGEMFNTVLPEWRMLSCRGMPITDITNLFFQRIIAILE